MWRNSIANGMDATLGEMLQPKGNANQDETGQGLNMVTVGQSESQGSGVTEDGVRRRDFIHIAAVSWAGVGVAAIAIPLVRNSKTKRRYF